MRIYGGFCNLLLLPRANEGAPRLSLPHGVLNSSGSRLANLDQEGDYDFWRAFNNTISNRMTNHYTVSNMAFVFIYKVLNLLLGLSTSV